MKKNKSNIQPAKRSRKARVTSAIVAAVLVMNNLPLNEMNGALSPIGKMFSWLRTNTSFSASAEDVPTADEDTDVKEDIKNDTIEDDTAETKDNEKEKVEDDPDEENSGFRAFTRLLNAPGDTPVVDYSPEDFNINVTGITEGASTTEYTINSYTQLVYYSKMYNEFADTSSLDHSTDILNIGFTSATNVEYSGYESIGTSSKPFKGTIKISSTASSNMNLAVPMFKYLDVAAQITDGTTGANNTRSLTITKTDYAIAPLFANHVVNSGNVSTEAKWEIISSYIEDNSHNKTSFAYAGLVGDIAADCKVNIKYTNNATDDEGNVNVSGSSDLGLFCGSLGANSVLTANLDSSGSNTNYSITTTSGSAGGIVGNMASGSKLILTGSGFGSVTQSITGQTYAGGIVGEAHDAYIGTDTATDPTADMSITSGFKASSTTLSGGTASGYLFGYYKNTAADTTSDDTVTPAKKFTIDSSFRNVPLTFASGKAGGYFGVLENNASSAGTIVFDGGISDVSAVADNADKLLKINFGSSNSNQGGVIYNYKTNALANSLNIKRTYVYNETSDVSNYGGAISVIDNSASAYVKIEDFYTRQTKSSSNSGGLVCNSNSSFIDVSGYIRIKGNLKTGLIYSMPKGVMRLAGTTDFKDMTSAEALIARNRNEALIYSKGTGTDSIWTLKRVIDSQKLYIDDVYSWGQVVRLTESDINNNQVVDESNLASGHYVTIPTFTATAIANRADFIRLALHIQLKTASSGATGDALVMVGSDSATLLSNPITIASSNDIDLSGTGVTGLTRDNGDTAVEFTNTFNGGNKTITLSVGEAYGYKSDGSTPALNVNDGTVYNTGRNYLHQYTGLFAKLSGASSTNKVKVKNVTIDGDFWLGGRPSFVLYSGGIASLEKGYAEIENVVSSINMNFWRTDNKGPNCFVAGFLGNVGYRYNNNNSAYPADVDFKDCTTKVIIDANTKSTDSECFFGGFISTVNDGIFNKDKALVTLTFGGTTGCKIESSYTETRRSVTTAKYGGLIAYLTKQGTESVVNVNKLFVNDSHVTAYVSTTSLAQGCAGLLGYEWYNSSIYINDLTVGNTTACSIELDSNSSNNALLAGLCTFSTGYWCVDKIEIDKLNVTGKNASPFGMLVNTGERLKDGTQALYLELKDKTKYTISSTEGDLTFNQIGIYDELMAYSWWYKRNDGKASDRNSIVDNDAAVISININATGDPVIMDGSSCNTYQNQSYYGKNTASAKVNPNSRYYYNLYTIRNKSTKTDADKLMLWSVYQYANSTFRSKFNPSNVITSNYSISGDLDMTGYSYYPIDYFGTLTFGAISKLKFANAGIEASEKTSADSVGRTTVGTDTGTGNAYHTQHYMMHCGLFRNYNSVDKNAYTLTTNNMVIEGSVGRVNNAGSGFIVCGTLGGNPNKQTTFTDANTGNTNIIKLNGAYVNGAYVPANGNTAASYPYSPLLINKVAANTVINLYGVQTTAESLATGESYLEMQTADADWSAASSLIGQVGALDGSSTNISLDFGKLTLDSRISDNNIPSVTVSSGANAGTYNNNADYSNVYKTSRSIFNQATLLHWFIYNTGCNGTYNYTVDEDWASSGTNHPHNVTYGQENTYSIDNGTLKSDGTVEKSDSEQKCYSASRPYLTNPLYKNYYADGNEYYDFSKTVFRPYVGEYDTMDGTTHVAKYHELEVNLTVANLVNGCGCYNDPYVIDDPEQLVTLAKILRGDTVNSKFEVRLPHKGNNYLKSDDSSYDQNLKWCTCSGTNQTCKATFSPNGSEYTSNLSGVSNKYPDYVVRGYLAGSYYQIADDLILPAKFAGLGAGNEGRYAFRGVIVGKQDTYNKLDGTEGTETRYPCITNKSANPLILTSNGSVVKNIIVQVNDLSYTFEQTNPSTTQFQYNAGCASYGAVMGKIMGGDNIIDNVQLTFSNTTFTMGIGSQVVPVGGYVGAVVNGGLFFRNMTTNKTGLSSGVTFSDGSNTISNILTSTKYLYVNPIIGRVINGYSVYEDVNSLNNGTKSYSISRLDDSLSNLEVTSDNAINAPNEQAWRILSMIVNSGTGSTSGSAATISYDKTNYKATHIGTYADVGCKNTKTTSNVCDKAIFASNYTEVVNGNANFKPYIIYKYTTGNGDARSLTIDSNYYDITMSGSAWSLPKGYRGIGGFNADNIGYQLGVKSLNGGSTNISLDMLYNHYQDITDATIENYLPAESSGFGLFNKFKHSTGCTVSNLTLSGTVEVNAIDQTRSDSRQRILAKDDATLSTAYQSAGCFAGIKNNGNTNTLTMTGVNLSGVNVKSAKDAGGLFGTIADSSAISVQNFSATDIIVSAPFRSGGMIGSNASALTIGGDAITNKSTVTINSVSSESVSNQESTAGIGGVIGVNSNASLTITNLEISKSTATGSLGKVTLTQNYNNSDGWTNRAAGGIIGLSGGNGITVSNCNVTGITVSAYKAGGAVGRLNGNGGTIDNVHLNGNSKVAYIGGDRHTGTNRVGGIVGSLNDNNLTVSNCSVTGYTFKAVDGQVGGAVGIFEDNSVLKLQNFMIKGSEFQSATDDTSAVIGKVSGKNNQLLGYNIVTDTITATNKYSGDLIGYLNNKAVKVVGFSRNNTPTASVNNKNLIHANAVRCEQTALPSGSYIIFSDYNSIGYDGTTNTVIPKIGGTDATMVSAASPYATVNPALTIVSGNTILSGDAVAETSNVPAKTILADMRTGTSSKRYDVTTAKSTFENFLNSVSYANDGSLSNISTFKTEWRGSAADSLSKDFSVLVLEDNSHKRANDMITSYIKLLTNCEGYNFSTDQSNIYSINIYKMQLIDGSFVATNNANLKRESSNVNSNTRYYMDGNSNEIDSSEAVPTFSLIDISFNDPTNTENIAYHLYIPVFVKKMLKYDFNIATGSGTNYESAWYSANNRFGKPVVENLGSPATIYFSYTYLRTREEWQNAVNYGDKLLSNYTTKKLNIALQGNPGTPISNDTVLVLVDRNNYDKHYYSTFGRAVSNGELSLSSFKENIDNTGASFTPVYFNNYLTLTAAVDANGKYKKLTGTYADDEVAVAAGAEIRATDGYYATIGEEEEYEGTRYSLTVTTANDATTGYVPMEESYYISFFTPSTTAIQFSDYQIDAGEVSGYSSPARVGISQNVHVVFGNLFTQNSVSIMPNYSNSDSAEISSNNPRVNARLRAEITLNSTAKTELDAIMRDASVEVYQSFLVYATKHDQTSTVKAIAKSASVTGKYSINGVAGAEKTESITGTVGTAYIEVKTGQNIKSQLLADGANIEADITITYASPDSRTEQFAASTNHGSDYYTDYSCNSKVGYDPNNTALSKNTATASVLKVMHYYITSVDYAKLEYNAYAEDNAPYGQLGINASDLDGETSPVEVRTRATYDLSPIANDVSYSTYDYVMCELELRQKEQNSDDYSDPLVLKDYLSGVVIDDSNFAVAYKTPREASDGTTKYTFVFPRALLENATTHILNIPITFYVYTGTSDFESSPSRLYSNYEVDLTVQLIDNENDWNVANSGWDKSKRTKYIKYTNARLYTKYIKASGS